MSKPFKNNNSAQQARRIKRNRAKNKPRLKLLKETIGCYACGRLDVDGDLLDGHHYDGSRWKYQPLGRLLGRPWRRIIREILGLDRDQENGGGPIVMWCQRYHEDFEKVGDRAKTCPQLSKEGFICPERVPTRNPRSLKMDSTNPEN